MKLLRPGRQHLPALGGGSLDSRGGARSWLISLPAWQGCDLGLSSVCPALGSIYKQAAVCWGEWRDAGRGPLCLLSGAWGGLFQRQVAKENQSLNLAAEEPPMGGALL